MPRDEDVLLRDRTLYSSVRLVLVRRRTRPRAGPSLSATRAASAAAIRIGHGGHDRRASTRTAILGRESGPPALDLPERAPRTADLGGKNW